jgi:hypothetical protein
VEVESLEIWGDGIMEDKGQKCISNIALTYRIAGPRLKSRSSSSSAGITLWIRAFMGIWTCMCSCSSLVFAFSGVYRGV